MQSMKQLGGGLTLGLLSAVIVIGAILLALAEGITRKPVLVFPTETEAPITFPSLAPTSLEFLLTPFASDTPIPSASGVVVITTVPSLTFTVIPCGAPANWVQYVVVPNDNLYQIGLRYRISVSDLQKANCLGASILIYSGQKLWVPNVATSTPPATSIVIDFPTSTLPPTTTPTATNTLEPTPTATATASATATSTPSATPTATTPPPAPP